MATLAAEMSSELLQRVRAVAAERGVSAEWLAGQLVGDALRDEDELAAAIAEGRRQIAAGEGWSHDALVADLQRWKRERAAAA